MCKRLSLWVSCRGTALSIQCADEVITVRKISVRLPEELLEEVDALAELEASDRTTIMKQALREYLDRERTDTKLKELAARRFLEGRINYRALCRLLGPEEAEAVRTSKRLLDQGAKLARKLA
jgi:predicted DNA-binding protein